MEVAHDARVKEMVVVLDGMTEKNQVLEGSRRQLLSDMDSILAEKDEETEALAIAEAKVG